MSKTTAVSTRYVRWFDEIGAGDIPSVGGKNASLGEMIRALQPKGIEIPYGFATTAEAYRNFLRENGLEEPIERLRSLPAAESGVSIRELIGRARLPEELVEQIRSAYRELSLRYGQDRVDVAVRSSATAEDLPEASFAGQLESFLNVRGEEAVLDACRRCFASLFTDRAIAYRREKGLDATPVAVSVGFQKMVRSDLAGAGVLFTLDTETGFPNAIVINAGWGLGENVVKGTVTPDEYTVFKPLLQSKTRPLIGKTLGGKEFKLIYDDVCRTRNIETSAAERTSYVLNDDEILLLARWGAAVEEHYGRPMDIEWAKDGESGRLFLVQARPETVHSARTAAALKTFSLKEKGKRLIRGLAIGEAIAAGKACVIPSIKDLHRFRPGSILVTEMTDPDWGPILKKAAGIVTDQGGRTCHAAIVSRELGIPAIVGTGRGTRTIPDDVEVTLSCAEGDQGFVYEGRLRFEEREVDLSGIPPTRTRIMMNIASPAAAFRWWRLPCEGIGLARMEFIINNIIKIHPMALVRFDDVKDPGAREAIETLTRGYADKTEYFVEQLALGIAKIAASQHPHPVIVRTSDFKTNEYANLIGGAAFEPKEENPMLGFRGASRYYSEAYRDGFALECRALKRVREEMGLANVVVMIPFCRRIKEADLVLAELKKNGLARGENGLQVYVMCEIPSNVILAEAFAERFDGFSIGSNDLTQLTLGIDRDSAQLAELFDERDEAVTTLIRDVIRRAHARGCKVGICGQAPSDYPEFAEFLVEAGIDSISLNPDSVVRVKRRVAQKEREREG